MDIFHLNRQPIDLFTKWLKDSHVHFELLWWTGHFHFGANFRYYFIRENYRFHCVSVRVCVCVYERDQMTQLVHVIEVSTYLWRLCEKTSSNVCLTNLHIVSINGNIALLNWMRSPWNLKELALQVEYGNILGNSMRNGITGATNDDCILNDLFHLWSVIFFPI